jgi:NADPH2:quinone reductase
VPGGVGSVAAQLDRRGGATVIGTVRGSGDLDRVDPAVLSHAVAHDAGGPAADIRSYAPQVVHRVIAVSLSVPVSANADLDNAVAVAVLDAVAAAYGAHAELPFWPLLFNNVTLRLLGSDDFPDAKRQAARGLTAVAAAGALTVAVGDRYPLEDIVRAHDCVDAGGRGRIPVALPR